MEGSAVGICLTRVYVVNIILIRPNPVNQTGTQKVYGMFKVFFFNRLTVPPQFPPTLSAHLALRQTCEICRQKCRGTLPLCSGCRAQLPWIQHGCTSCGEPVRVRQRRCSRCEHQPLPFAEVIIPLRYAYPVDQWVGFYKYQSRPGMAGWLSQLLQDHIEQRWQHTPTLMSGVPMHPRKQRERGYNQSLLLARQLARAFKIPFDAQLLEKHKITSHQRTLNAASRRLNLQGAFRIKEGKRSLMDRLGGQPAERHQIQGQAIALVDDVVTTGATSAEIAQCLLEAGAASVSLWALAKTPLHHPAGSGSHMPLGGG